MADDSTNVLQRDLESIHPPFANFIRAQATSSPMLLSATIGALWWVNSDYSAGYQNLTHTPSGLFLAIFSCRLHSSCCDLFPVQLATRFTKRTDTPMATDTAFAFTLARKHIPGSLLAFIIGLAIVDDVAAVMVIAVFYTREISALYLAGACALIALLMAANYARVHQPFFYIVVAVAVWWIMLKSGVHPTFAGVAVGRIGTTQISADKAAQQGTKNNPFHAK